MSINSREGEKLLKSLANKRRLEILKFLKSGHRASVGDIASHIKLSFKSTSRHLSVLFSNDIVENEQESLSVYYSLSSKLNKISKSIIEEL